MDGQIPQRERLSKIEETLNGNGGNDGLKTKVRLIEEKQDDMHDDLKDIARSMSAIAKSQLTEDVIKKHSEENRERRTKAIKTISIVFGIVLGSVSALKLILDHIKTIL